MAKLSKRMQAIREKLQPGKLYPLDEAFALLKELPKAKFAESIDVAVNLGSSFNSAKASSSGYSLPASERDAQGQVR